MLNLVIVSFPHMPFPYFIFLSLRKDRFSVHPFTKKLRAIIFSSKSYISLSHLLSFTLYRKVKKYEGIPNQVKLNFLV